MSAQPAPRISSTAFGLLMAAASAAPASADWPALLAALAGAAVLIGLLYRPAATVAVLASAGALAMAEPAPLFAAVAGLSGTAYLVIRHAVEIPDVVTTTRPTMMCATVFTIAGLAAVALPAALPWIPLLAPVVAAGIFLLALRPFVDDRRWEAGRHGPM
ncbi:MULTISPECIES: hypothetical protein [unclassified Mycolicibacterium]|uniref:hypothetical protein n=1 Tax=unclassified Mycolicibacterium TaxID=2636767 RepID=UPI0012DFB0CA|nr:MULTISPECIES: hypothetical protein [unclassified Mycolicibacterium]MUL82525.1 hypothetical protein [Mycolicibacterium sp. CBMA 329]MUL91343.1 hypothetical protein [Mycolicibacterium sp. CBMA 331]MUM29987.1 hypothetical protein [Mycolicibacterium sp. CBMA 295]MUM41767.1 hypothetical protein [Mycolicibacterium sp. CBMA 247]MUM47298.1 hypothetical protein [Mycolicibacterium sp. CBMA 294]